MLDQPRYYHLEGRQLVSVTTFLRVLSKPFLMPWYVKMERENVLRLIENARDDNEALAAIKNSFFFNKKGEVSGAHSAADEYVKSQGAHGRACHAGVESFFKDKDFKAKMLPRALERYKTWKEWWLQSEFEVLDVEETVHDLDLGYAGTLDLRAKRWGEEYVIDWKFGKGAGYAEHHLQNVAYRHAGRGGPLHEDAKGLIVHVPSEGGPVEEIPIDPKYTMQHVEACLALWHMENDK